MKRSIVRLSLILAAAATAAGCATDTGGSAQSGVSVTRFHLNQPIARGEIAVEASDLEDANSIAFAERALPVARELTRLGWTVTVRNPNSEHVAVVRIEQGRRAAARRSGLSIGIGGGTGGYRSGVGVGLGTTIPIGGSGPIVVTELSVRIQRRSDATAIWEGRAQLEARESAPLADPRNATNRLAAALFEGFPGESGRTIRVR
ncbi:MAG: DUF4136 domain-containing protein [Sphingomonas sp.]|nr:DUF4136 domain-containing protein [Sphingomonas sp.]